MHWPAHARESRAKTVPDSTLKPMRIAIQPEIPIWQELTSHATGIFGCGLRLPSTLPCYLGNLPGVNLNHVEGTPQMPIGTVKFFNSAKGYGFIAPDDGTADSFVHISAVERAGMSTLQTDQRLKYEVETDNRGKSSAVNLEDAA